MYANSEDHVFIDNESYEQIELPSGQILKGHRGGKLHAILEFTVPNTVENYGVLLRNGSLGTWIMIRYE